MNFLSASDKYFWHRYTDDYLKIMKAQKSTDHILEYGVFLGHSITWLKQEFPLARIVGMDIVDEKGSWPKDASIEYRKIDQGNREQLSETLAELGLFYDLIIEDGSHHPDHQLNSLICTLPWVREGSIYIVEDIHTCLTEFRKNRLISPAMKRVYLENLVQTSRMISRFLILPRKIQESFFRPVPNTNILSVLLFLERSIYLRADPDEQEVNRILAHGKLTKGEFQELKLRVKSIKFVKRTGLPLSCYDCGSEIFDLAILRCFCGRAIYQDDESMSAILTF